MPLSLLVKTPPPLSATMWDPSACPPGPRGLSNGSLHTSLLAPQICALLTACPPRSPDLVGNILSLTLASESAPGEPHPRPSQEGSTSLLTLISQRNWDNPLSTPKLAGEWPWGPLYPLTSQGLGGARAGGRGHPYTAGDWLAQDLVQCRAGVDPDKNSLEQGHLIPNITVQSPHLGSFIATNLSGSFSPPLA